MATFVSIWKLFVIHASVLKGNIKRNMIRRWWYKWAVNIEDEIAVRAKTIHFAVQCYCYYLNDTLIQRWQHCDWPTNSMLMCSCDCVFTFSIHTQQPLFFYQHFYHMCRIGITTNVLFRWIQKNLLKQVSKYTKQFEKKKVHCIWGNGYVSLLGGNIFWDEWNSSICRIVNEIDFTIDLPSWVNIWLFFNFSLPTPAIVKILQFLIAIFVLMHSAMTIQTVRMICCVLFLAIMLKYFKCWSGSKILITWVAKVIHQRTFFAESCVHCIDVLTIFIVSGCHYRYSSLMFPDYNYTIFLFYTIFAVSHSLRFVFSFI